MSVLRSIENKIEGLFEGVFGRAFRTHVQPIELARWLAKEMDLHRSVSVSRVYVPNEYTIYLSPADRAQFASYEGSLIGELQEYLAEHARREGYALLTPPRVLLATDPDLAMGESGVATRVVQPEEGLAPIPTPTPRPPAALTPAPPPASAPPPAPAPAVEPAETVVYRPEPEPPREVVTLALGERTYPITSGTVVIGRSRECDIRVGDANVSRRHAEIREEDETYWLIDLGSTNGTELNGRRVDRAKLSDGDTITLGATELRFRRSKP